MTIGAFHHCIIQRMICGRPVTKPAASSALCRLLNGTRPLSSELRIKRLTLSEWIQGNIRRIPSCCSARRVFSRRRVKLKSGNNVGSSESGSGCELLSKWSSVWKVQSSVSRFAAGMINSASFPFFEVQVRSVNVQIMNPISSFSFSSWIHFSFGFLSLMCL